MDAGEFKGKTAVVTGRHQELAGPSSKRSSSMERRGYWLISIPSGDRSGPMSFAANNAKRAELQGDVIDALASYVWLYDVQVKR